MFGFGKRPGSLPAKHAEEREKNIPFASFGFFAGDLKSRFVMGAYAVRADWNFNTASVRERTCSLF